MVWDKHNGGYEQLNYWEVDVVLWDSAKKLTLDDLDRGYFEVNELKIVCGVSPVRDGSMLVIEPIISSDDLDFQEDWFGATSLDPQAVAALAYGWLICSYGWLEKIVARGEGGGSHRIFCRS